MKLQILVATGLTVVLVVCGLSLRKELRATQAVTRLERSWLTASPNFAVRSIGGVDVWGRRLYDPPPADAKRFLICGFREASLRQDMATWTAVSALLAETPGVYVAAYCDGEACAEAVRTASPPLPFPVVGYGEPVSAQAVLAADGQGTYLVLDGKMRMLRRVTWRRTGWSPADIAKGGLE